MIEKINRKEKNHPESGKHREIRIPGKYRHRIRNAVLFLILAGIVLTVHCPLKYLTGISCPGCGMTRALISLLTGHFRQAMHYHPLVLLVIPGVIVYFFRKKIPVKLRYVLLAAAAVLLFAVYFIRLSRPDEIVSIDLREGAVYKWIVKIFN